MGILDVLVDELNKSEETKNTEDRGEWKRLHSEQYQIVQTRHGIFRNPVKSGKDKDNESSKTNA